MTTISVVDTDTIRESYSFYIFNHQYEASVANLEKSVFGEASKITPLGRSPTPELTVAYAVQNMQLTWGAAKSIIGQGQNTPRLVYFLTYNYIIPFLIRLIPICRRV